MANIDPYGEESPGQLTEFKRRNGFEQILLPRTYIPLTAKGRVALRLKLHRGTWAMLPGWLKRPVLDLRTVHLPRNIREKGCIGLTRISGREILAEGAH